LLSKPPAHASENVTADPETNLNLACAPLLRG
jgi:hypothetical protein